MKTKFIQTNQYNRFSFFNTNREINLSHVKKIMHSIQVHGLLEEITCNEKYEVIDGQHRFIALKNLNLPILAKIKIGATADAIIPSNIVRRGWTIMDYINYYSQKGYEHYNLLEEVIAENKDVNLGTSSIIEIYYKEDTHYEVKKLRSGNYKIDVAQGNYIRNIVLDVGSYVPIYGNNAKFVRPINRLIRKNPNISISRLKSQLKKHKVHIYPNEQDTMRGLIDIYNRRLTEKNRI
ncbi:MAG: ParB N-terminal domain-containing protein [Cyanophyceae cyanobacterium]